MASSQSYSVCREDFLNQQTYRFSLANGEFLPDSYRFLTKSIAGAFANLTYPRFVDTGEYFAHITHILRSNRRESDDLFDRPHGTHG